MRIEFYPLQEVKNFGKDLHLPRPGDSLFLQSRKRHDKPPRFGGAVSVFVCAVRALVCAVRVFVCAVRVFVCAVRVFVCAVSILFVLWAIRF